jgi:hypothetical protein
MKHGQEVAKWGRINPVNYVYTANSEPRFASVPIVRSRTFFLLSLIGVFCQNYVIWGFPRQVSKVNKINFSFAERAKG